MNDQVTACTLYKKLFACYPRAFKERFGESMEQTFIDLHRERRIEDGWFSCVLWMFVETAMGIAREHVLLITEGASMKTMLANPRSAAVISFILCVPAAIILLFDAIDADPNFWPLPISPEIVVPAAFLLLPVGLIVSGAPVRLPAIISFLLVSPFMILEWVNRENFSEGFPILLFGFLWLLSTAFIAILMPIVRNVWAGNKILANPLFLLFSFVFFGQHRLGVERACY